MNIFIPIKENSQRVPGKNFRKFKGKKLYQHVISNILKCDKVSKIYIDTDSDEIINFYKKEKRVEAYKRKRELIGDKISVCDLIYNCIKKWNLKGWLFQLHVTSPLLKIETLYSLNNIIKKEKTIDSIVSCNKIQTRLWRKESYGWCPINHNPMKLEQTQDLPSYYEENSAFYGFKCDKFLKYKTRIGQAPYFYEIDFPENIDIDEEKDWEMLLKIV